MNIPIPEWILWSLIGGTILSFVLIFFIVLLILWTPAAAFLKAKLKNLPVFLMNGRDGVGGFYVPEFSENQYAHFKNQGTYGISRDSHIYDRKSKQPIYIADKDIGASVQKDWPKILEQLKEKFPNMKNGKDYKKIVAKAIENINDNETNPEIFFSGSTMRISDLAKFFPLNIKPTYIDEYAMIAVRRDRRKQNTLQFWIAAGILALCVGIAGYLLIGQANKGNVVADCSFDIDAVVESICENPNYRGLKINETGGIISEVIPNTAPGPGARLS